MFTSLLAVKILSILRAIRNPKKKKENKEDLTPNPKHVSAWSGNQ